MRRRLYRQPFSESQSQQFRANMDPKVQLFSTADQGVDQLHTATLPKKKVISQFTGLMTTLIQNTIFVC